MTDSKPDSSRRGVRGLFFGLVWIAWTLLIVCALIAMPTIRREHFVGWLGAQPEVIDDLVEQERFDGALSRIALLEEHMPWDPRPAHRRADVVLAQVQGRVPNPAADPAVAEAYETAVHRYMSSMMYPYLLSPEWKRRMSSAMFQWAACLSQEGNWDAVSMCLQAASDIDLSVAQVIFNQLASQARNPSAVESQILNTTALLGINLLPSPDATRVIDHVARGMDPADHLRLRILLAHHSRNSPDPDLPNVDLSLIQSDLPLRLAFLQLEAEPQIRAGRLRLSDEAIARTEQALEGIIDGLRTEWIAQVVGRARVTNAEEFPQTSSGGSVMIVNSEMVLELPDGGVEMSETGHLLARGQPALGVWPIIEVVVNGGEPQVRYVHSDLWTAIPISVPDGVLRTMRIRYLNDGATPLLSEDGQPLAIVEDRNVTIHSLWTERTPETTETQES